MSYINETDFVIENKELVYPEIITDGLQLYYDAKGKRDTDYHRDTMLDMSGNKNHGNLQNFAYEKHSGYKDGLVFDYIDDKLVRPTLNLKSDDLTFMLNGNIISFSPDGTVKRVQDGEVIESKGVNLVRNGDFVDGTEGWMSAPGYLNRFDVIGNTAVNREETTNNHRSFIYNSLSIPEGNIVYSNFRFKQNNITKAQMSILYSLSGVDMAERYYLNGSENEFEVYSAVGPYGPSKNFRLMIGNIESDGNTTIYLDYLMLIDLTETFGAGNEPNKEQMDEIINRFGFIPNAQDLIDRIEYKGNDLGDIENIIDGLYKTEVLSGEEIYTDKADDDAVVHVGIDGKSYQHAGSGKNLFNGYIYKGFIDVRTTDTPIPSNPTWPNAVYSDRIYVKPDTTYILSGFTDGDMRVREFNSDGIYTASTANKRFTSTNTASFVRILWHKGLSLEEQEGDIQLEEGSVATEYELPAPYPDAPIEIHSLNDFDVVSQKSDVSGRNLIIRDTETPNTWVNGAGNVTPAVDHGTTDYIKVEPNTDYMLTKNKSELAADAGYFRWGWYDVDMVYISRAANANNKILWKTPNNVHYIRVSYPTDSAPKLEKGNKATDWTPAPEDNHPLIDKIKLLLDEPLRSMGDVKDRLFRDSDGLWKVERNIAQYVFTGDETFGRNDVYGAYYNTENSVNNEYIVGVYSNYLKASTGRNLMNREKNAIGLANNSSAIRMSIVIDGTQLTHDTIKPWLSQKYEEGKPLVMQYLLNKPTTDILPISIQDKLNNLRSFSESNYVYTIDGDTNLLDTVPLLDNHQYASAGVRDIPTAKSGHIATQEPMSVYPGAKIKLTKIDTSEDKFWRIVWVDKENNIVLREVSTDNDLVLTTPSGANGMRVSYPTDSNAVIRFDKSDISLSLSENLKPTLHAKFLYNNWYKEDRVINNLMIYSRALTNEEMLQNYTTIKRRWGM